MTVNDDAPSGHLRVALSFLEGRNLRSCAMVLSSPDPPVLTACRVCVHDLRNGYPDATHVFFILDRLLNAPCLLEHRVGWHNLEFQMTVILRRMVTEPNRRQVALSLFGVRFLWLESYVFDCAASICSDFDEDHWNH